MTKHGRKGRRAYSPPQAAGSRLWEARAIQHPISEETQTPAWTPTTKYRHPTPRLVPLLIFCFTKDFTDNTRYYFLDVLICKPQIRQADVWDIH